MKVSVSSFIRYLKNKLDTDDNIQNIVVAGEISNFRHHQSGHLYFSLKDESATIQCVMFRYAANGLQFTPKNGDKVLVKANTSIFEASGQLQLYVVAMKQDGIGDLFLRFEKLKKKLLEEGLFLEEHKKKLPLFPMKIAVLVGDKSAALSDIRTIFARRWPIAKVDYYPVLVQGNDAPKDMIENLRSVDELGYDAIILARGGGSFEDLFCFNDEALAYTIYHLKTPLISGVGHEQDFTIADFVADLRAPTPTAAVELLTPDLKDVANDIVERSERLGRLMKRHIRLEKERLGRLKTSRVFMEKGYILRSSIMKLEFLSTKLYNSVKGKKDIVHTIDLWKSRMDHRLLEISFQKKTEIAQRQMQLKNRIDSLMEKGKQRHKRYHTLLEAYGFDNVLKRGYTLIMKDGHIVRKRSALKPGDDFNVRFQDGEISAVYKEEL